MEQLRTELNTRITLEQYLEKIGEKATGSTQTPPTNSQTPPGSEQSAGAIKPEDIEALIDKRVSERERARIQEQNVSLVKSELEKRFGNDYVNHLTTTAQALGLSQEAMTQMAKENPKVLLKLVGADGETRPQQTQQTNSLFTPPRSEQTTGFSPTVSSKDWNYYENIRKKDPSRYFSVEVQNEMHREAMRLGEKFYPTN